MMFYFDWKVNTAIDGCLLCVNLSLLFSVLSRDMKSGGTAKILYGVYATQIIKQKLWKPSALYSSAHSKEAAPRNRAETADFLLANI